MTVLLYVHRWCRAVAVAFLVVNMCLPIFAAAGALSAPPPPPYLASLLTTYTRAHAPLTPYAAELVTALRSMDADLVNATAPILHPAGSRTVAVHPIGFSIPPEYVRAVVPAKGQALATVIPGAHDTYKFLPTPDATPNELTALERGYYADMERAYFGLTWKKAGWDCLRHLELLAAGCVPLFTDIGAAPAGAVAFLPKRVLRLALRLPGVEHIRGVPGAGDVNPSATRDVAINPAAIDPVLYSLTVTALLDYTRRHLTTPRMAAHVLATMGVDPPYCRLPSEDADRAISPSRRRRRHSLALRRQWLDDGGGGGATEPMPLPCPPLRVLYLALAKDSTDYMADTLAHGFVTLLGPGSVTQHHRREVLYTTPGLVREEVRAPGRASQYGFGFTYGNTLFDLREAGTDEKADSTLRQAIAARAFDIVVFSLIHRGPPPLMDAVCAAYPPGRIAAVHGHDTPPSEADLATYTPCAGFFFAREA